MGISNKDYFLGAWIGRKNGKVLIMVVIKHNEDGFYYAHIDRQVVANGRVIGNQHTLPLKTDNKAHAKEVGNLLFSLDDGIARFKNKRYIKIEGDIHAFRFKMAMENDIIGVEIVKRRNKES